ncbi:acylphosphatase [Celerinatantimonas diazotrophica]|uniref:acylphosphatase n=1 Tax=Celerinatantimonas diazotrophica TaxID=412034 RepID=A0A4R1JAF7_9GAMM|nr:acylphosphatase [Celerinatantimonas diazotrophica]TCK47598.1 acylphosphatase [Celerinatantimonas diazotrophica]CAG9296779.1 Acylphosphatase [Celerinatantimonas diazotrophica]
MVVCKRILVSGRVQGVGYRFYTMLEAKRLGLVGFARNLNDGRVEVVAKGAEEQVSQFIQFLNHASPAANVTSLQIEENYRWDGKGFSTH